MSVKVGKLQLTEAVPRADWERPLAYQSGRVRLWLNGEIEKFATLSIEHEGPSPAAVWYVFRAEEIYGPVTAAFLRELPSDEQCFSLALKLKASVAAFRAIPGIKKPVVPIFFNRRSSRKAMRGLIHLDHDVRSVSAMTLDVSVHGIGLYVRSPLTLGQVFRMPMRMLGGADGFSEVRVESVTPFESGLRCGLSFVNLPRPQMKALQTFLANK